MAAGGSRPGALSVFDGTDGTHSGFTARFKKASTWATPRVSADSSQIGPVGRRRSSIRSVDSNILEGEPLWRSVFQKMQDDGQIHHDDLALALELAGFGSVDPKMVDDVYYKLTTYSAISVDDFVELVRRCFQRQKDAYINAFKNCDVDRSNTIDQHELADLLRQVGIEPMRHVLEEVYEETDPDMTGTLDFQEFENVMDLIHYREGFTKREHEQFMHVYEMFDFDKSGEIDSLELTSIMGWLGYLSSVKEAAEILAEVDVDRSGTLNQREYLICMRKVREREVAKIIKYMKLSDKDGNGVVSMDEMVGLVRMLGYLPHECALREAAVSTGIQDTSSMDLSSVWQLLSVYRSREGFSSAEAEEIREAFTRFDAEGAGEIDTAQVGKLLRWLGYVVPFTFANYVIGKVDVNNSGRLDLPELRKMMRLYNERERRQITAAFEKQDVRGTGRLGEFDAMVAMRQVPALEACGLAQDAVRKVLEEELDMSERPDRTVDVLGLVVVFDKARKAGRKQFRDNMGFSPKEMVQLRETFKTYETPGLGHIGAADIIRLMEGTVPNLVHTKTLRSALQGFYQQVDTDRDGCLHFAEFLALMKLLRELVYEAKHAKLREVVEKTGFSPPEVEGFRELFLGKALLRQAEAAAPQGDSGGCQAESSSGDLLLLGRGADDDESWFGMTFKDVKILINRIVPLGDKSTSELAGHFGEVEVGRASFDAVPAQGGVLDFPDFLVLMRRLLDVNFGRMQERACEKQDGSPRRGQGQHRETHQFARPPPGPRPVDSSPKAAQNVRRLAPLQT
jgi:Ca2+-binding EF-hand superfamily protein